MTSTALPVSTLVSKNSHSRVDLPDPRRWVLYGSHFDGHVRRLIVFIHGFLGKSIGTWLPWALVPVSLLGAGARPGRVMDCCFEHAGQNFDSLDRGPHATHPMDWYGFG